MAPVCTHRRAYALVQILYASTLQDKMWSKSAGKWKRVEGIISRLQKYHFESVFVCHLCKLRYAGPFWLSDHLLHVSTYLEVRTFPGQHVMLHLAAVLLLLLAR